MAALTNWGIVHSQHLPHLRLNTNRTAPYQTANTGKRGEPKTKEHIMAFLNETIRGASPLATIRTAFANLADAWNQYIVFRRTYEELSALSTRELQDMGVSRSMITRLAYEAAYGKNA